MSKRLFFHSHRMFLLIIHCLLFITFSASCSSFRDKDRPAYLSDKSYAVASWYGSKFHGRPTSSGEIFDMHARTCAHKEYPFGTFIKVTNIENNRTVDCIVNDRGPFIDGRDIDLSYAAAKEINMIGPGLARVLLEINGRDNSYVRPVKVRVSEKTGPFTIQVGAFTENINAVRLKVALSLKYADVHIHEAEVKGAIFYRVRVGNYNDYNRAFLIAEQLGQEGYQTLLLKADVKI